MAYRLLNKPMLTLDVIILDYLFQDLKHTNENSDFYCNKIENSNVNIEHVVENLNECKIKLMTYRNTRGRASFLHLG